MSETKKYDNISTMVPEENTAEFVAKFKKKRKRPFISLAIMILSMVSIFPLGAIIGAPLPGAVSAVVFLTMGVSMVAMFVYLGQCKAMQARMRK